MARYRSYGRIRSRMGGRSAPRHRRKPVFRATPRVAKRLREIGKSDRFSLYDRVEAVQAGGGNSKFLGTPLFAMVNTSDTENFQINGLRLDFTVAFASDNVGNNTDDGFWKLAIIKLRAAPTAQGTDAGPFGSKSARQQLAPRLAKVMVPWAETGDTPRRELFRGVKLLKSQEIWPPYVAKKISDTRPDSQVQLHWNLPAQEMRPQTMIIACFGGIMADTTDKAYFLGVVRAQATSGDIEGGNQAPGYLQRGEIFNSPAMEGTLDNTGVWYDAT